MPSFLSRWATRVVPLTLIAGVVGSLVLALSLTGTLSAFTASIRNSTNTVSDGSLVMREVSGSNTCLSTDGNSTNAATCSTINKYGGTGTPLVPGTSQTQTVTFTNTGSVPVGSSNLVPTACSSSKVAGLAGATTPSATNTDPSNLCSVLQVAVYKAATATGTPLYTGALSGFTATQNLGTLAVNAAQAYTFVISLPSTATTAVQGQLVTQPLTWNFNQ